MKGATGACRECGTPVIRWELRERGSSILDLLEVGSSPLCCGACGSLYTPVPWAAIAINSLGVLCAAALASIQKPLFYGSGRIVGEGVRRLLNGDWWGVPSRLILGLLLSVAVLSAGMFMLYMVNQATKILVWRLNGFRFDRGESSTVGRVRVDRSRATSGTGKATVLLDGEEIGPCTRQGLFGLDGCCSWFQKVENGQPVEYFLRIWGEGTDVYHMLLRNGKLWSQKRPNSALGAFIAGALAVAALEIIGMPLLGVAELPTWVVLLGVVIAVPVGSIVDSSLWKRMQEPLDSPPGTWLNHETAKDLLVLRPGS